MRRYIDEKLLSCWQLLNMAETMQDDPNPMTGTSEDNCHHIQSDNNNNSTKSFAELTPAQHLPSSVLSQGSDIYENVPVEEDAGKSVVMLDHVTGKPIDTQGGEGETLRVSLQNDTYVNPETGFIHNIRVPNLKERLGPSVICLPLHQVSPDTTMGVAPEIRVSFKDVNNNKRPAPDSQNDVTPSGAVTPDPEPVGSRPKRPRKMYKPEQIEVLEKTFQAKPYPTAQDRTTISMFTNLSTEKIKVWFQNRRSRERRRRTAQLQAQAKALALSEQKTGTNNEAPKLKPLTPKPPSKPSNPANVAGIKEKVVTAAMGAPLQPQWMQFAQQRSKQTFKQSPPPTLPTQPRDINNNANVSKPNPYSPERGYNSGQILNTKTEVQPSNAPQTYCQRLFQNKMEGCLPPLDTMKNSEPTYAQLMPAWTHSWQMIPPQVRTQPAAGENIQKLGQGCPKEYPQNWPFMQTLGSGLAPNQAEMKNKAYTFPVETQYQYRPNPPPMPSTPPMLPAGYFQYGYPYCNPAMYAPPHMAIYQAQPVRCPPPVQCTQYPKVKLETQPQPARSPIVNQYPAGQAVRLALHKKLEEAGKKQFPWCQFAPIPAVQPYQYQYQYQQQQDLQVQQQQEQLLQQQQQQQQQQQEEEQFQQQLQHQQIQMQPQQQQQQTLFRDNGNKKDCVDDGGSDSSTLSYPDSSSSPVKPLATSSPNTHRLADLRNFQVQQEQHLHASVNHNMNVEPTQSWVKSMETQQTPLGLDDNNNNPTDTNQTVFTSNTQTGYYPCDQDAYSQASSNWGQSTVIDQQLEQQQRQLEFQEAQRPFPLLYQFPNWGLQAPAAQMNETGMVNVNYGGDEHVERSASGYSYGQFQHITHEQNIPADHEVTIPSETYTRATDSPADYKMVDCPPRQMTTINMSHSCDADYDHQVAGLNNNNNQEMALMESNRPGDQVEVVPNCDLNNNNNDDNNNVNKNGNVDENESKMENRGEAKMLVSPVSPVDIFEDVSDCGT